MKVNSVNNNNKSIKIFKVSSISFYVKFKKIFYIKQIQADTLTLNHSRPIDHKSNQFFLRCDVCPVMV